MYVSTAHERASHFTKGRHSKVEASAPILYKMHTTQAEGFERCRGHMCDEALPFNNLEV